jgi:glycerophosphoryl diester phosphodiesterase
VAAFERALAAGVGTVEVDVRRGPEGWVAQHDPGPPWLGPLTAVVDVVAEAGGRLMVDLKEIGGEEEALAVVLGRLPPERVIVSTLEDESVAAVRAAFPELEVGLSLGRQRPRPYARTRLSETFPGRRARACGATFLSVNRGFVRLGLLRRAALPVYLWTVDEEAELRRYLRDPRLRGVVTNRPIRALELLREG